MRQVPPWWQSPGLWLHSLTSCRHVGPWKPAGQWQIYDASKGRHWPPLAQGFEAQGSACWHVFPGGEGGGEGGGKLASLAPASRGQCPDPDKG